MSEMDTGHARIANAVLKDGKLSGHAKLLYCVARSFMDSRTREAHPSYNTLAELCGCSRSTAIRSVRELEDRHLLERRHRRDDETMRNTTNVLVFTDGAKFVEGPGNAHQEQVLPSTPLTPPSVALTLPSTPQELPSVSATPYLRPSELRPKEQGEGEYVNAEPAAPDAPPPTTSQPAQSQTVPIDSPHHPPKSGEAAQSSQPPRPPVAAHDGHTHVAELAPTAGTSAGTQRAADGEGTADERSTHGARGLNLVVVDHEALERIQQRARQLWDEIRFSLPKATRKRPISTYAEPAFKAAAESALCEGVEFNRALLESVLWYVADYFERNPESEKLSGEIMSRAVQDAAAARNAAGLRGAETTSPEPADLPPALNGREAWFLRRDQIFAFRRQEWDKLAELRERHRLALEKAGYPEERQRAELEAMKADVWRRTVADTPAAADNRTLFLGAN